MAGMSFDWREYLNLASILSGNADEASQRTAISRAYYAVFHAATLHAKANGYGARPRQAVEDVSSRRRHKR